MKKNNKWLRFALAALIAIIGASVLIYDCNNVYFYSNLPSKDAVSATDADEQAAVDVVVKYFDAVCARDVQTMTDTICSPVRLKQLNQANGATEANFYEMMEANIKNMDIHYGTDAKFEYDPQSIVSENADQHIDILNEEFRIDREKEPIVDMARIVSLTVWMNTGTGEKVDVAEGSMLVYRHDGEWYIYGSAK